MGESFCVVSAECAVIHGAFIVVFFDSSESLFGSLELVSSFSDEVVGLVRCGRKFFVLVGRGSLTPGIARRATIR